MSCFSSSDRYSFWALRGKAPGVLIQAQSGQPGAPVAVTIRGKGSIIGTNSPLYVVDGVQINKSDFSTLNPADFASCNVLKDAARRLFMVREVQTV